MNIYPSKESKNAYGRSLVATTDLNKGTVIGRFTGHLSSFQDIPAEEIRYAVLIDQEMWMIPTTEMRFLNHSCQPNCLMLASSLEVITIRDVQENEELTISYNAISLKHFLRMSHDYFWDERRSFTCQCGADNCDGLVNRFRINNYEKREIQQSKKIALQFFPGKGRGVIATERIEKGELIESAPVIISSRAEWPYLEKTALKPYAFWWEVDVNQIATLLGYGSLYNHSYEPNAVPKGLFEDLLVDFIALRTIEKGEEITFNYKGGLKKVWFEVL